MKGFEPNLLDKLFDDEPRSPSSALLRRLTVEQLKETVAKDVECLLNTRVSFDETHLQNFKHCQRSTATYGLNDFSGRSLVSFEDRRFICESISHAIARHEPRLRSVKVSLELDRRSTNVLHFSISALLVVSQANEQVTFDALLQPSSLKYSVNQSRRANHG